MKMMHEFRINNAGMFSGVFDQTVDGYEKTFAVNHLAHHYLTSLLTPMLTSTASQEYPGRIVYVSSDIHPLVKSSLFPMPSALDIEKSYSMFPAYARSKLANILDSRKWAKQLEQQNVLVNAVHPGSIYTGIFNSNAKGLWYAPIVVPLAKAMGKVL